MNLTVAHIYSVRFCKKLPLPQIVQDNIAKLRITTAAYKPMRHSHKHHHHKPKNDINSESWRVKCLANYVSRIKDSDDPDYHNIFAILNKVSPTTLSELSKEATQIIQKRDEEFRLRISTLLFNKAISESMFASIMAEFAVKLVEVLPEVKDDMILQSKMFPTLYDINTTLTFPSHDDPDFDNKVIFWMKQKDRRRGYAKFVTQMLVKGLIAEDIMIGSIENVLSEMRIISKQPKTEITDENVNQFVDFIFESSKLLPEKCLSVKGLIKTNLADFLAIPRSEVPSLGMRSRFRLEDALKCVQ